VTLIGATPPEGTLETSESPSLPTAKAEISLLPALTA
jgi:hypothetical protein